MQPLRILLVDDHEGIRRGIRRLLSSRPDWQVCGEAANGREGIKKATELTPDLILMDISMPEMGGLEATIHIRKILPGTRVIMVSQIDPKIALHQTQSIGAAGFVAKTELSRDLIPMIDKVVGQ
jgi:DNA-binding NarL/FixJ family response regulator